MRLFIKIALLFGFLTSSMFANINEYKSDLYYANGIMMEDPEPKALKKWRKKVENLLLAKPEVYKKIANVKISYNQKQSFWDDVFEALEQKISDEWGMKELSEATRTFLEDNGYQTTYDTHRPDLYKQVQSYKQSIKDGHGVIVIAHSQGNYYTNEAYAELDGWMKKYFHMFGVATPADHVAEYTTYNPADSTRNKKTSKMGNFVFGEFLKRRF